MSKFNFTSYMHDIAVLSKDIAHVDDDPAHRRFYRASSITNLEEIIQGLPEFDGFALVVEDNQQGKYLINASNKLFDGQLCCFFVVRKANIMDAADRGEQIRNAEIVMRKIISKIRQDYENDNANKSDIGLRNMDWNSLNYFSFGPVLDNCYGVFCSFIDPTVQNYKYNAADWNE